MLSQIGLFNYFAAIALILIGMFAMLVEGNYVRKIIGMAILQTGVILFFITVAYKTGSAIPILPLVDGHSTEVIAANYANPLPHALMLTAIVVGVSTLGVALTLLVSIFHTFGTLEENEIMNKLSGGKK